MIVSELMRLLKALPKSAPVMVMADGKGGFCVPAITIKTMASAPAEVMPGGYVQVDRSKETIEACIFFELPGDRDAV